MKKAISFLAVLLIAATAFATPRLVSFSNKGGKTTVVFTLSVDDRDSSNGLGIDKIVLECNGKTYTAQHVDAKFGKNTTTVTVKFKKIPQSKNGRLKFKVNGMDKYINL